MVGNAFVHGCAMLLVLVAVTLVRGSDVPEGAGLAARYPGDVGIENDGSVVFTENFEVGDLAALKGHWSTVGNKAGALAISDEVPPRSAGQHSVSVTAKRGENEGGYFYKVLEPGYEELYARIYVKFAPDYGFDHHFCSLGGEIDPKPYPVGRAGQRPEKRFGTGIEPTTALLHTYPPKTFPPPGFWHFYTYWPEMHSWQTVEGRADGRPNAYYGNNFSPAEPVFAPRGEWICLEWMVKLNSDPGKTDGAQRFWINGKLIGDWSPGSVEGYWVRENFRVVPGDKRQKPFGGFRWRDDMAVKINKFKIENYVSDRAFENNAKYKEEHPDFLISDTKATCWFDDIVVATEYIGPLVPTESPEGSAKH